MSLAKCDMCDVIIDTDENPEAYYQRIPNALEYQERQLDSARCEDCQCKIYNQLKNNRKGIT